MVPIRQGRISSVFDMAGLCLLVDAQEGQERHRREVRIEKTQVTARAKKIVDLGTEVIICGAISWQLEAVLASAGIQVIPNTCGYVEEVLDAFLSGRLTEQAYLMPGCDGQRRRHHK
jgi:predicted Fe-Mo cluster-binding NifX family protein